MAGAVEDMAPLYRDAALVINPVVAGTGAKIKTIEALCHLRPMVTWPAGVDGLDPALAARCIVVRDWYEFANAVVDVLTTPRLAGSLRRIARSSRSWFRPRRPTRRSTPRIRTFFERHGCTLAAAVRAASGGRPAPCRRSHMPIDVFIDLSRVPVGFDVGCGHQTARHARVDRRDGAARDVRGCVQRTSLAGYRAQRWLDASSRRRRSRRAATRWPRLARMRCRCSCCSATSARRLRAVGTLLEAVEADPMIGFASARLTGPDDGSIARLDAARRSRDRRAAPARARARCQTPISSPTRRGGACSSSRPSAVNSEISTCGSAVWPARLWHYMSRVRRCGFRTVICNRAVVDATAIRDPARHPRSPSGTCRRPTACCFASCLPMSRRRSSSSARRMPPSVKRGSPARSLARTAPVRRCCSTAATSSPA